ncbi:MAG: pyridoxamine 5'-phosphate oxidase family protein [Bacteroidetes bacterium]|nr:MAG: pyridoxamine 5'-phosphate oxidase family protein [Bacteroidota bacterium]
MKEYPTSKKNKIKRGAKRGSYNIEQINDILDATSLCYIAFNFEGQAMVQPISFGRKDNELYIHGSYQNRMTESILEADSVSISVTHLDGLLLARSAFHHSVNYRSAIIFGKARELKSNDEKLLGLKALINHVVPNRWEECRFPTDEELKATRVIAIEIKEASAKIKRTPVSDNKEDYELDYWAGEIPIVTKALHPVSDEKLKAGVEMSKSAMQYYKANKKMI